MTTRTIVVQKGDILLKCEFGTLLFLLYDAYARFQARILLGLSDALLNISLELSLLFEGCRLLPVDALKIRPIRLHQFRFLLVGPLLMIIELCIYRSLPGIKFLALLFLQCSVSTIYALLLVFAKSF